MDEFAFYDIPDSIDYILSTTHAASLSYIGFSQGTAQAFATLSIHPTLNAKVDVFIALAPAMSPAGLSNGIVDALVKASPQVLFLLFGRRSILSSTSMWQSILYPPIFVRVIDTAISFLFNWKARNISPAQKLAAYPHLYSFTSTKSVVHWFQIIRTQSFQMYDDDFSPPLALTSASKYTKAAKFPTRNIKTPIVLVFGGSDSLVDIKVMLRELPQHTIATEIPHYEHLDFLWAKDAHLLVFPHVFDALESFADAEHTKEDYQRFRAARHASLGKQSAAAAKAIINTLADQHRIENENSPSSISGNGQSVSLEATPTHQRVSSQSQASTSGRDSDATIGHDTTKKRAHGRSAALSGSDSEVGSVSSPGEKSPITSADWTEEILRSSSAGSTNGDRGVSVSFEGSKGSKGKSGPTKRLSVGVSRPAGGVISEGVGVVGHGVGGRIGKGVGLVEGSGSEGEGRK
jgi:lysosomal acid lipase/cholesteryl ester hydrolase